MSQNDRFDMAELLPAMIIFNEVPDDFIKAIFIERHRQNQQWGGPAVDDTRDQSEWLNFMAKQIGQCNAEMESFRNHPDKRDMFATRIVKIIALGFAALESMERKSRAKDEPCMCAMCQIERMQERIAKRRAEGGGPNAREATLRDVQDLVALIQQLRADLGKPR